MSNQERRLMRRIARQAGGPRETGFAEWMENELAEKRDRLAERLLEIALEQFYPSQFIDTKDGPEDSPTQTVKDWFTRIAEASIAAAEVIYPEIPNGERLPTADEVYGILSEPLPTPAQEGAQSVGGFPVLEPRPTISELEARLNRGEQVDIAPDGTIRGEG